MPRKQVNLSFTDSAYELVTAAAEAQGVTINQFCRTAIMDAASPLPEDLEDDGRLIPAWLLALTSHSAESPAPWEANPAETVQQTYRQIVRTSRTGSRWHRSGRDFPHYVHSP